jgi:hypothetical protein
MASLSVALGAVTLRAADTPPRTIITREQISNALAREGVKVTPPQVESLCAVTATQSQPRLRVVSIHSLDERTAKVQMRCDRSSICLPFYLLLHWWEAGEARSASAKWGSTVRSEHPQRRLPSDEILVRSGRRALLVFEGTDYRIQVPVLCMESGTRGQLVRVMSTDRKKVYVARVVSPTVLQGSLLD